MISTLVKKLREMEDTTGVRLVSTELEIISVLYHEGPVSVQTLMGKVRASSSGFHLIKKSMQDTGLIAGVRSNLDARVKRLDLAPALRENLAAIQGDKALHTAVPNGLGRTRSRSVEPSASQHA